MAVGLLLLIAGVLAWGTIYETRFGTAAVQQFIYRAWWFQALLGFLALNLAVAALRRYPWQRKHVPFVLAHIGIILILFGGILGGRFGIDGQLIIPEGEANGVLQLPQNVLVVSQPNPGVAQVLPTHFETTAWNHEPHALYSLSLEGRSLQLVVDRYYPDAVVEELVTDDADAEDPAVHLVLRHEAQEEPLWLFARDPERFGVQWGDAHVLFLEPATEDQLAQWLGESGFVDPPRGTVIVHLPGRETPYEIPVPERLGEPIALEGSPYVLTFKQYFADLAITEDGVINRSDQPDNPAIALTLSGPEGTDAHLLFGLHPEFPALHGRTQVIPGQVSFRHPAAAALPPNAIAIIRRPDTSLSAVFTGAGGERQVLGTLVLQERHTHPSLGYEVEITDHYPRARLTQQFINRGDTIRAEALHVMAQEGEATAQAWVGLRGRAELPLGKHPVTVEYRPAQRELPFTIKLLDFRKIDYPGTEMAAGFESDVELTDPQRGMMLMRKISMNNPLRYRGFSFYQSSFIEGPVETTVLSVRSDPGTPFVYAGFLIVIAGVVTMFIQHRRPTTGSLR